MILKKWWFWAVIIATVIFGGIALDIAGDVVIFIGQLFKTIGNILNFFGFKGMR